jgi:muconolactone delta-isomerase
MRFLVEMSMKVTPTPEIMGLMPGEIARGQELDAQGVREQLLLAADNSRAWQVLRAESREALNAIVASYPMAPYSAIVVTQLAEPQAG